MSASLSSPRLTRRTRIVCISDTHNSTVKLPKGDVLIHAGDLTNQGSYSELSKAVQWLEKADCEARIVIAGNHDITLDDGFYSKHGPSFHNQNPQDPSKCLSLLTSSPTITYLNHSSTTVRLTRPSGPQTEFTIFGSPHSPRCGTWAFMYSRSSRRTESPQRDDKTATSPSADELWAAIPRDTDILVTHTPASNHCDDSHGCEELQKALAKVRPRLHVCGHIHQGRGAERVMWDTDGLGPGDEAVEVSTEPWQDPNPDPASAKISLVDLTTRGGKRPLDFHVPVPAAETKCGTSASAQPVPCGSPLSGHVGQEGPGSGDPSGRDEMPDPPPKTEKAVPETEQPVSTAVARAGRRETCVVNCAIVATSWPHTDGKRFNKPIVVDIDLPVWS